MNTKEELERQIKEQEQAMSPKSTVEEIQAGIKNEDAGALLKKLDVVSKQLTAAQTQQIQVKAPTIDYDLLAEKVASRIPQPQVQEQEQSYLPFIMTWVIVIVCCFAIILTRHL